MELLLAVPDIGRRFRQAVRADVARFAALVRRINAEQKGNREANLMARERSRTIDLDYFCRYFNKFVNVLPWIEGMRFELRSFRPKSVSPGTVSPDLKVVSPGPKVASPGLKVN